MDPPLTARHTTTTMMDNLIPIKQGETAASGAASITVEKHKNNFMTLHGLFEDKQSQNIVRWLAKAQKYKDAHMIPSLEMASIVIHSIRGEPAIKVRRMLDVPGENYINADHFCEQPLQEAIAYTPFREARDEIEEVLFVQGLEQVDEVIEDVAQGIEAVAPVIFRAQVEAVVPQPAIAARPTINPVRHQPEVRADQCLKHYLTRIYKKEINLSEAERFLNTFKTQKPRQTCSNFLDEFVIHFENFAYLKWNTLQLDGVQEVIGVEANPDADPPVEEVLAVDRILGNQAIRDAELMQLVNDGICKEFKVHCDNTQIHLTDITFPQLEIAVLNWQRNTTTGKAFTKSCTPATLPKNANVSALEMTDYFNIDRDKDAQESYISATLPSQIPGRGQRGGRGSNRARPARGRGNKARVENNRGHTQSKDVQENGFYNYRQNQDGTLQKSLHGQPICNYCGTASHKRENCGIKKIDRSAGLARTFHPNRDKPMSYKDKAKSAAVSFIDYMPVSQVSAADTHPQAIQHQGYPFPRAYPPPTIQTGKEVQSLVHAARLEHEQNANAPVTAGAQTMSTNMCPYQSCQAFLPDQQVTQEHFRMFHSQQPNLATMPGDNL